MAASLAWKGLCGFLCVVFACAWLLADALRLHKENRELERIISGWQPDEEQE
ncbi:hypothetical protein AALC25_04615 [Lachnospiraceae bacterium 29-84]